jgi:hypothetical protein
MRWFCQVLEDIKKRWKRWQEIEKEKLGRHKSLQTFCPLIHVNENEARRRRINKP